MSDYDAWKCTDDSQEGPTCPACGGWLIRDPHGDWVCPRCDDDAWGAEQW